MSAYACDPYGGSEAHNGWYTAENVAIQGVHVTLATRPGCRSNVERYLSASPVSLPIFPEYIMHKGPGTLIKGELGVYASYIQWQRNLSRWVGRQRTSWDIAHHVSWGSIDTPCSVLTVPAPGVIGPVGGGQVMNKDHYRWMEGATRWENLRTSVARASLINPFARTTTTRSQLVLVENQETRDKAVSLGARRVEMLLANCLPKDFISSDARPAETRSMEILWVGRFMPRKAANLAAESFASVVQRVPDAKLKFVGEGPSRAAVEQLVRDLGLEKSVTFTGRLSHADVQTAYESSAAMLFSSLRDSSGAQVLEAAAKGCPVIALNQSGVGYWYPENAGIKVAPTPADDLPQRLADAMVRMLTMDDEDWVEMSSQALEWAREHTWEVRGEELISIYKGLLSP